MHDNRDHGNHDPTTHRAEGEARVRTAARPARTVRAATLAAFLALGGVLVACGPNDAQGGEDAGAFGDAGGTPAMTDGPTTPDTMSEGTLGGTDIAGDTGAGTIAGGGAGTDAATAGDATAEGATGATDAAAGTTDATGEPMAQEGAQEDAAAADAEATQEADAQTDVQTVALTTDGDTLVVDEANSEVQADPEQGVALSVGERYEIQADGPVALVDAQGEDLLAADASDSAFATDPEVAFESDGDSIGFTLTQDLADLLAGVRTDQASVPVVIQGN